MPEEKITVVPFTAEEQKAFEADLKIIIDKYEAVLIAAPYIGDKGQIEASVKVFKKQIPSPYAGSDSATPAEGNKA